MMDYPWMIMFTPGGKGIRVQVINPKHPVSGSGGKMTNVPLVNSTGKYFLAEIIRERIDHKKDCPIAVSGDRGVGKSTIINSTSLEIDPELTTDSVVFRIENFAKRFHENQQGDGALKKYPIISMDEAGYALFAQQWVNRMQQTIAKQLIISRIKRQIVWFAVPRLSQLNNQVRNMPYIWIHVQEPTDYLQGYAEVHLSTNSPHSKWYPEKQWAPQYAFTYKELTGPFWDAYEKKKIDFVNEVSMETAAGKTGDQVNDALNTALELLHNGTEPLSLRAIGDKTGIDFTTISKRLKKKNTL